MSLDWKAKKQVKTYSVRYKANPDKEFEYLVNVEKFKKKIEKEKRFLSSLTGKGSS